MHFAITLLVCSFVAPCLVSLKQVVSQHWWCYLPCGSSVKNKPWLSLFGTWWMAFNKLLVVCLHMPSPISLVVPWKAGKLSFWHMAVFHSSGGSLSFYFYLIAPCVPNAILKKTRSSWSRDYAPTKLVYKIRPFEKSKCMKDCSKILKFGHMDLLHFSQV